METSMHDGSILSMLLGATLVVKFVLLLLGTMSLVSWSLIFYKVFLLSRAKTKAAEDFESFQRAEDLSMAMQIIGQNPSSPVYSIGYQAVTELKRLEKAELTQAQKSKIALDNLNRTLRQSVKSELKDLGGALPFLATCGNVAPFIGLFGTVWGIMHSFQALGQATSAALSAVAPGISEALITTAIGLAVAIPASIAYNFFLGMLGSIEVELDNFADIFLNRVQRELTWAAKAGGQE
jgi:biopolymer transport protein TolQ